MRLLVLDNVKKRFMNALNSIGLLLKKNNFAKDSGNRNIISSSFRDYRNKFIRKKDIIGHKGSSYKGKGSINTDATIFNRLRKDRPYGKQH